MYKLKEIFFYWWQWGVGEQSEEVPKVVATKDVESVSAYLYLFNFHCLPMEADPFHGREQD